MTKDEKIKPIAEIATLDTSAKYSFDPNDPVPDTYYSALKRRNPLPNTEACNDCTRTHQIRVRDMSTHQIMLVFIICLLIETIL